MKRLTLKCAETTLIIRLAVLKLSKMMGSTQMSLNTSLKSMIRSGCCISNCFFPNAPIPILRRRSIETWRHTLTQNSSRLWKSLVKLSILSQHTKRASVYRPLFALRSHNGVFSSSTLYARRKSWV